MNEPAGSPITLLFSLVVIFLLIYLLGILPWRRRKKKKVSPLGQIKFTYIMIFILAGMRFISGLSGVLFRKELVGIYDIVFGAGFVVLGVLVMKKSMRALIFTIVALILHIPIWSYIVSETVYLLRGEL